MLIHKSSQAQPKNPGQGVLVRKSQRATARKVLEGAAQTAGGAMAGLALGAVGGQVLTSLGGSDAFASLGGGVGAAAGAATSAALSLSDRPISKGTLLAAWAGGSAGMAGGMFLLKHAGAWIAANGGPANLGIHGAAVGALACGLYGASVPFKETDEGFGRNATFVGRTALLMTTGMLAGSLVQAALSGSSAAPAAQILPTLGSLGVALNRANSWVNDARHLELFDNKSLNVATRTFNWTTLGLGTGMVLGAAAGDYLGSAIDGVGGSFLGAAMGLSLGLGLAKENDVLKTSAATTAATGAGFVAGELVGRGLTALTGQSVFAAVGPIAGAVTAGSAYLHGHGKEGFYLAPVAVGLTVGASAGALLGAGLTALTGQTLYQNLGTAIGAVTGACGGVARSLKEPEAKTQRGLLRDPMISD
jgi:hypothetical protein